MAMEEFRCLNCGSNEYVINEEKGVKKCRYCGTEYQDAETNFEIKSIAEKIDLDMFKDARKLCEERLAEAPKNATLHWMMFQIKNSIKFVIDPATKERKPTFRSESFTRDSVFNDESLKLAIEYASNENKKRYENWATLIENIRLEICDKISQRDNYDVFISFKSTMKVVESNGDSKDEFEVDTRDRQIAKDVYNFLTKEGYRVFFSDVALGKDKTKAGELYEPTIFAALASCRAMVVIGTKEEYVNYGWVKDEWSRYFYFMGINGGIDSRLKKKPGTVFYVFDRVVPRGLPDELASLQGIDYDRREEFYDTLLHGLSSKIGHGANRAGIERIELGKVVGKKAKTANVDSLGTVELGSGNAAPRQQKSIEGNLAVKKFGLNKVRKVDSSIENDLKTINLLINNKRFSVALSKIDDILAENENGEAYFYKILCSIEAKNPEEFIDNSSKFNDFELFEKTLDCSDAETANRVIDMFVEGFIECFNDVDYDSAVNYFKQLIKYETTQRAEVISVMQQKITELISKGMVEEDIINLIDAYLLSIDPNDVDRYIEECLGFAHVAHQNGYLEVANRYMSKVKEIDEGNPEVTMFRILLQTGSSSPDQLVDNISKIENLEDIVYLIKNSTSEQASMCMQIFVEGVKKALIEPDTKALEIFKTLLTFNFDGREDAKKEVLDIVCKHVSEGLFEEEIIVDFVEYLLKATDAKNVDEHISINKTFAIALRESGKFDLAKKYLNKVLELDNSELDARYNLVLALAECTGDDITDVVSRFKDEEGEVIKATAELLNYSYHENASGFYSYNKIISIFTDAIFKALEDKKCSEADADAAYCNIIRYIQDTEKELLVERLLKMGKYLILEREFALASKYFKLVLEEEPKNFEARWNCVLIELGCISDFDVIAADIPLETCAQYDEALKCASPEQTQYLCDLASKQEKLKNNPDLAKKYDSVVSDNVISREKLQEFVTCSVEDFENKIQKLYDHILELKRIEDERRRKEAEEERKRRLEEERKIRAERERRRNEAKRARREVTAKAFSKFFLIFVLLVGGLAGFGAYLSSGFLSNMQTDIVPIQNYIVIATCVAVAITSFIAYIKARSGLIKLEILVYEILTLLELVIFGMVICDSILITVVIAGITISALSVYIKAKVEEGSNCIAIFFINLIATVLISATYYYFKFSFEVDVFDGRMYIPILMILFELAMYILGLIFTAKQVYSNYEGKKAFANVMVYILYSLTFIVFSYVIVQSSLSSAVNSAIENSYNYEITGRVLPSIASLPWLIVAGGTAITSFIMFLHDADNDEMKIAWLTWMFYTIFTIFSILLSVLVMEQFNHVVENIVAMGGIIFGFIKMNINNYRDKWKASIIWLLLPFILLFVVGIFGAIGNACNDSCDNDNGSSSSCGSCGGGCSGCGGGFGAIIFIVLVIIGIFKKDD